MSSLEQEPVLVTGVAVSGVSAAVVRLPYPGTSLNVSLAAPLTAKPPFRSVRVRGLIWVTGTAAILTAVQLESPIGSTIGVAYTQGIVASADVPMPFEWVDANPVTGPVVNGYIINVVASAATTVSVIASITGYDA
jgi:hypothetical protein